MATEVLDSPGLVALLVAHVATAAVMLGIVVHVGRSYRDKPIGRMFTAMVATATIWIVGSGARIFAPNLDVFVAVTAFKYVGIVSAPVFLLFFALLYDGKDRWVTRRTIAALLVVPVLSVAVIATTRTHGLYYSTYSTTPVGPLSAITITGVGPWYWVVAAYSWGGVAVASALLVYAGLKRSRFYRIQLVLLVPAILVVWASNLAYVFFNWPHIAIDPTPFGFAITSLLLAVGVFSTDLVDVTPAARATVLDAIDDAIVVLDPDERVIDVNEKARTLFEYSEAEHRIENQDGSGIIGKPALERLSADLVEQETDDETPLEFSVDGTPRYYRTERLPVGPEGAHGSVIALTDVTSETLSQRQTERINEDLETLNRILRHDIRSDMGIITRYGRELDAHVDEEGEQYRQEIIERGEHTKALTETLGELMETMLEGEKQLRPVRVDSVLEYEIEDVRTAYEDARVEVVDELPDVEVRADKRLASVFRNILKNAIQHNDEDQPEVTVTVEEREEAVEIRIADNGPGIPDDAKESVFGKGEKGLESKGTGIGLYLVSLLVEEYDGEVRVEDRVAQRPAGAHSPSDTDSGGSVFVVELPTAE